MFYGPNPREAGDSRPLELSSLYGYLMLTLIL
jgi:hypothetical protein